MKTSFDRNTWTLHIELTADEAISRGYQIPQDIHADILERRKIANMTQDEKRDYLQKKFAIRKYLDDEASGLLD